jgi:hypothetical protein
MRTGQAVLNPELRTEIPTWKELAAKNAWAEWNYHHDSLSNAAYAAAPSFGERQTPIISSAFAAIAGPLDNTATHSCAGSVGMQPLSPKSRVSGLTDLWRGQGGPKPLDKKPE